jgi:hypothetical protein
VHFCFAQTTGSDEVHPLPIWRALPLIPWHPA